MSADAIVNIQQLVKTYPGKTPVEAVKGIDLAVERGELFGLLGPNGAGKSTTISVCTTRSLPTAGRVSIAGIDVVEHPSEARRYMGVVTQFNTLDRQCTVWENLYFHCRYFGIPHAAAAKKTEELLELFKLTERSKTFVKTLSGGLAQRVQIARAIAHNPEVLFLDEPSAGLDPQTRILLWEIIREYNQAGKTILLTTHYMEEADALCDRLAIVDHGKMIAVGTPKELKSSIPGGYLLRLRFGNQTPDLLGRLQALAGVREVRASDSTGTDIYADRGGSLIPEIASVASSASAELSDVHISEPSLENLFLHHTGRSLRD